MDIKLVGWSYLCDQLVCCQTCYTMSSVSVLLHILFLLPSGNHVPEKSSELS